MENGPTRMKHIHLGRKPHTSVRGYSLIELLVGLLIGTILTAMAIPHVTSIQNQYRLQGAVDASTWAIQSTRYQALMAGYPYQVVFSKAAATYQIQNLPTGAVTYANVGGVVPLSGSSVSLNQDTTLQFQPNGAITATKGALNFTLTYNGSTKTITVTNYGNISVTP
jgi:prepilin-type N-terminal cleavage/methylation domain-containing protein